MKKLEKLISSIINDLSDNYSTSGKWDKAGRYYIDDDHLCECCKCIRSPSRNWPYTRYKHEKTKKHAINYTLKMYKNDIDQAKLMTVKTSPLYINSNNPILKAVSNYLLSNSTIVSSNK